MYVRRFSLYLFHLIFSLQKTACLTSPTEGWSGWQLPLLPKLRAFFGGSTSTKSLRHWAQSCGKLEGWVLKDNTDKQTLDMQFLRLF